MTKKSLCFLAKSEKEEKFEKNFWKGVWISQRTVLKKLETRYLIDWKAGSINRTRQRLTEFLKQDFDWSKIRLDQSKFWKKCFLEKKTWFFEILPQSIESKKKNAWVWDEMLSQNKIFKPNFPKILILNNLPFI